MTVITLLLRRFAISGAIYGLVLLSAAVTLAKPIAKESSDGTTLQLIDNRSNEQIVTTLPIYRSGPMRYVAAGVGHVERAALYPGFPIRLVLSGSGGAYLSFIAITVWSQDGTQRWQIPGAHVTGPWVFLDLKDGTYRIDAVRGANKHTHAHVEAKAGQQHTVYFTWP